MCHPDRMNAWAEILLQRILAAMFRLDIISSLRFIPPFRCSPAFWGPHAAAGKLSSLARRIVVPVAARSTCASCGHGMNPYILEPLPLLCARKAAACARQDTHPASPHHLWADCNNAGLCPDGPGCLPTKPGRPLAQRRNCTARRVLGMQQAERHGAQLTGSARADQHSPERSGTCQGGGGVQREKRGSSCIAVILRRHGL